MACEQRGRQEPRADDRTASTVSLLVCVAAFMASAFLFAQSSWPLHGRGLEQMGAAFLLVYAIFASLMVLAAS